MLDFVYNTPTKVFFGKDGERKVGEIISELGYKKIMMQYGKNSIKKSGLYDIVINSLAEKYRGGGHACAAGATVYSRREANKLIKEADAMLKQFKENNEGWL